MRDREREGHQGRRGWGYAGQRISQCPPPAQPFPCRARRRASLWSGARGAQRVAAPVAAAGTGRRRPDGALVPKSVPQVPREGEGSKTFTPRLPGHALRRRRGPRSPSLSAALPSKIHLRKMKAHANMWRLLACAFNHGKLTLVPPGPPKMHPARTAPQQSWNSQRAAHSHRTRRLPRGFLALFGAAPALV